MALSGSRLAVTNHTAESWWLFLAHVWPLQIVLPSLGGSFWPTRGREQIVRWRNKSYYRVLVAFSGQLLAVANCTTESWWLFLDNSWPEQIVLPSLGGSFWTTLCHIKSYCRVLVALSWPTLGHNKSYCRVLVTLSGQLLAVTNRTTESWWLFLANSWP